jgi:hypothetical protein
VHTVESYLTDSNWAVAVWLKGLFNIFLEGKHEILSQDSRSSGLNLKPESLEFGVEVTFANFFSVLSSYHIHYLFNIIFAFTSIFRK